MPRPFSNPTPGAGRHRDVHREKVICDTGKELLKHWFRGVQEGGEGARKCLEVSSIVSKACLGQMHAPSSY